ncbi:SRPBCC family protein [Herpetosiphon gulosus]|uniref:SRPBCC family protein n=1 Tax=Herpetosiphon gulosus TaxID=1973496 RepID=A0ABP9X5L2_9CHLR
MPTALRISANELVSTDQSTTFGYVCHFENNREWWLPVTHTQHLSGEGVGAVYEEHAKVAGIPMKMLLKVYHYNPPQQIKFTISSALMQSDMDYQFLVEPTGTRIIISTAINFKWFLRPFAPLMRSALIKEASQHLGVLKTVLAQKFSQSINK